VLTPEIQSFAHVEQFSPISQMPFPQQLEVGVFVHLFVNRLQLSVVHALPSLQSESTLQQPAMAVLEQSPRAMIHVSLVHVLPSLQSESCVQQLGLTAFEQMPALHASIVHTIPSSQSEFDTQVLMTEEISL